MLTRMEIEQQISEIQWYHEFDFGDGLVACPKTKDLETHRKLWRFIRAELDKIDFANKSVLDIGCWDGYWSFYSERRGAGRVLATDDSGQNWAGESGFHLARKLLGSSVEYDLSRSIYSLESLGAKFDIILCLGVYYHLLDPFYGFSQIRHCCNKDALLVIEGDVFVGLPEGAVLYNRDVEKAPRFVPEPEALRCLLNAAYFEVEREAILPLSNMPGPGVRRALLTCHPQAGLNALHNYRPPFGLDRYDDRRFRAADQWSVLRREADAVNRCSPVETSMSAGDQGGLFSPKTGVYDDGVHGWRWASPMAQIEANRDIGQAELALFSEVPGRLGRKQTVTIHRVGKPRSSIVLADKAPVLVRVGALTKGDVVTFCSSDFFVPTDYDPTCDDNRLLSFALKLFDDG